MPRQIESSDSSVQAETMLICVPPGLVHEIWSLVAGMIDDAYAATDDLTPDVHQWLLEEKGLLWVVMRGQDVIAAITTSLVQMRSGLAMRFVACGGMDLATWHHHHQKFEDYARAEGCYKICGTGRLGWQKVLPGYETKCISFEKRI